MFNNNCSQNVPLFDFSLIKNNSWLSHLINSAIEEEKQCSTRDCSGIFICFYPLKPFHFREQTVKQSKRKLPHDAYQVNYEQHRPYYHLNIFGETKTSIFKCRAKIKQRKHTIYFSTHLRRLKPMIVDISSF